jgi:hypothetical protein
MIDNDVTVPVTHFGGFDVRLLRDARTISNSPPENRKHVEVFSSHATKMNYVYTLIAPPRTKPC